MKVAVLGAGSWGTALANVLIENGHSAILWARNPQLVNEIVTQHTNATYFPGVNFDDAIKATTSMEEAVRDAQMVIYAVPSRAMRDIAHQASTWLPSSAFLAHAVKGFDLPTLRRISEVIAEENSHHVGRIGVIAGPSHAEEVVNQLPTALVSASSNLEVAEALQDAFMNKYLRVYTQNDVIGVELGGALKNIIALGVGVVDGLGYGDNAKAAIMTRGLAEISRLGQSMGANALTFAGLTGVGDLIATCTSRHSRNLRAGRLIGQGLPADQTEAQIGMVVEGIPAVEAASVLADQFSVDMPIVHALHRILHHGLQPASAVEELMGRPKRQERTH